MKKILLTFSMVMFIMSCGNKDFMSKTCVDSVSKCQTYNYVIKAELQTNAKIYQK